MAIYVIGDLHLSFSENKPMDIFGDHWKEHYAKIEIDWKSKVRRDDLVILPGDTSWAMNLISAKEDLMWIDQLPGKKYIFKGNHDYWWTSLNKMNGLYQSITFIHNTFEIFDEVAICGTRGWICPNGDQFEVNDEKIYKREGIRLENSLIAAKNRGFKDIIGVLHYPPTNEQKEPSIFTDLFEKYGVTTVVYGHIHSKPYYDLALQGEYRGVVYHLTSCDYLNFKLKAIRE